MADSYNGDYDYDDDLDNEYDNNNNNNNHHSLPPAVPSTKHRGYNNNNNNNNNNNYNDYDYNNNHHHHHHNPHYNNHNNNNNDDEDSVRIPSSSQYDPEMIDRINLHDGQQLEEHLQVMDVRNRLRQKRRRAICLFSIGFCVVVTALIVGAGITSIGHYDQEEAIEKNNEIFSGGKQPTTIMDRLPFPPADLGSKCALTKLGTKRGIAECESACEIAECCNVPQGYALSCLSNNQDTCPQYQRYCNILNNVGPADDDGVDDFSANIGFIPQQDDDEFQQDEDTVLKLKIDSSCIGLDPSRLIGSQCVTLCTPGACCFNHDDPTIYGCDDASTNSKPSNCHVYSTCGSLVFGQELAQIDKTDSASDKHDVTTTLPLAQQIELACNNEEDGGVEVIAPPDEPGVCENLCAISQCCFNHYCVPPENLECLDYAACRIIYENEIDQNNQIQIDQEQEQLAKSIHEACVLNNGYIPRDLTTCTELCQTGSCCFDNNDDTTTTTTTTESSCPNNVVCDVYAECTIVFNFENIVVTVDDMDYLCQESITPMCQQVCNYNECCFNDNAVNDKPCYESSVEKDTYCQTFTACNVIFNPVTIITNP